MKKLIQALFALVIGWAATASAAGYPDHPIRLIVPFSGGTSTDLVGRVLGEAMSRKLGQPVIVENRPGAGGSIGTDYVAKSKKDGYVLSLGTVGTQAINPALYPTLSYSPARDFTYISMPGYTPTLLVVRSDAPYKTLAELVAYAKAHPDKLSFGSAGNGTSGHLAGELLKSMASIQMTHIPFKEGGQALAAVLGGQVDFMFYHPAAVLPYIRSGKMRALAASSARRSEAAPDVATLAESGYPGFDLTAWFMLAAPAGVDDEVKQKLIGTLAEVLQETKVKEQLLALGLEGTGSLASAQLQGFVDAEIAKWSAVVKTAGARVD
ncbi:tripartite tricarboxylate transporter substrate binding protein [Bordetella sp. LUAb4]|uniref:Bug family tripartite tricarboxylate transporter substrate binding protein n=1 Tax=Bordetella sp. LUAb4 TaxID=2843195 RepID=UPI001E3DBAA9|nr:tripartite tricarboxylate transporter substrate binding protein [Bordetella sp. LUAb4]